MADRFDFELRAIEADLQAETTRQFPWAENWRDIARGYRMLSDYVAQEQAMQSYQGRHELPEPLGEAAAGDSEAGLE